MRPYHTVRVGSIRDKFESILGCAIHIHTAIGDLAFARIHNDTNLIVSGTGLIKPDIKGERHMRRGLSVCLSVCLPIIITNHRPPYM